MSTKCSFTASIRPPLSFVRLSQHSETNGTRRIDIRSEDFRFRVSYPWPRLGSLLLANSANRREHMQLKLVVLGFDPEPTLKEYVTKRAHFALDRFERCIKQVTVQVTDMNGPCKGDDKRCHMTAEFHRGGKVTIKEIRSDERAAVYHAAARLRYSIANRLRNIRTEKRLRITP